MEWVPAIISIMGAVVVWVNAALAAFTGGGILDWVLPVWWGMPAEGLAYAKPEISSGGQGISFQGVTFQGFCSTLRQKAIRIVATCSRVALSCGHR